MTPLSLLFVPLQNPPILILNIVLLSLKVLQEKENLLFSIFSQRVYRGPMLGGLGDDPLTECDTCWHGWTWTRV